MTSALGPPRRREGRSCGRPSRRFHPFRRGGLRFVGPVHPTHRPGLRIPRGWDQRHEVQSSSSGDKKLTDGPPGVGTVYSSAVKDAGPESSRQFKLTEFEQPTRIRWTELSKNAITVPDGGYDLEPAGDGATRMTISNSFKGHGFGTGTASARSGPPPAASQPDPRGAGLKAPGDLSKRRMRPFPLRASSALGPGSSSWSGPRDRQRRL